MLGLKHNQNVLVAYDPAWPSLFEAEKERLQRVLLGIPHSIEHYGSTAVPGLPAKPILDILIGVLPLDRWAECQQPLEALGYDYAAQAGVPGHHIFGRGRDRSERTHLVHIVEFEGASWRFNLAFRDALRANQNLRETYLTVKQTAVNLAPEGRAQYNQFKQAFFNQLNLENLVNRAKSG